MSNFDKLRNYVLETDFKITILKNKIDVLNYISIEHFDSNKIMIKYSEGILVINGTSLVVSKLLTDEVLITGVIKGIELR